MRWRQGFFRLWLFLSVIWAGLICAINVPTLLNPQPYFPEVVFIFDGASMDATRTSTYGAEYDAAVERLRAGTFLGGRFIEFENRVYMFTEATNAGLVEDQQAAVVKATMRKERADEVAKVKYGAISNMLWGATLPPLATLILGIAVAWIISGFRKPVA